MNKLRSITVGELLELLDGEDPNALVVFGADYGDYTHTVQAIALEGDIEEVEVVEEKAYSNSGYKIVTKEDEDDERELQTVLRIS